MSYDPRLVLDALAGVDHVLIGSLAGALHGSSLLGVGVEVCHSRAARNLNALAAAVNSLDARLRGAEDVVVRDGASLARADSYRFITSAGPLDCVGTPRGTTGYTDLIRRAEPIDVGGGLTVLVASLDDLVRMKRAVDHPKDRAELEVLEALRQEVTAL